MEKQKKNIELLIIGAGPAGLTSGIYASRSKLNALVLEDGIIGGQVRNSYTIENYPGFKKVEGAHLADLIKEQALELGAEIDEFDMIEKASLTNEKRIIETGSYIYDAKAVIIATGAVPKKLPIPNEENFAGRGIHYCAVCDGAMYEGKTIAVVGGGNSALEEAIFLTKFAEKVIMIRRHDYFNGERQKIEAVTSNPKIEIMYNYDLVDVSGDMFMDTARVINTKTKEEKDIKVDAIFGYIGTEPKTDLFKEDIKLDEYGYIITDENMRTNIEGVYAAGDVRKKEYRQITTAVSDGTIAALDAEKFILKNR